MEILQVMAVSAAVISSSLASPLAFYSSAEGSADVEDLYNVTSSLPTNSVSWDQYHQTTPAGPAQQEADFLSRMVDFLEDNMLLILVLASLLFLVLLIVCGAVLLSRRHKVNAYYPSSFPSKMYVDLKDKTGGARLFHELPEKAEARRESEPVDSHKQLQADIMKAAKSLRTPVKTAEGAGIPEDKPDGDVIPDEEQQPSHAEEEDACEAAAAAHLKAARSLRPASLHLHNDSATLQLIAGEKTAF